MLRSDAIGVILQKISEWDVKILALEDAEEGQVQFSLALVSVL